jgi:hypothetical protein
MDNGIEEAGKGGLGKKSSNVHFVFCILQVTNDENV